jgi:hypothetical protein
MAIENHPRKWLAQGTSDHTRPVFLVAIVLRFLMLSNLKAIIEWFEVGSQI